MREEAAFLQAMLENPNDLSLRLVFADWLEERGDLRGELLRLTHKLTQSVQIPRRAAMEARVQSLLDAGVQPIGPFHANRLGMRFAWIPPGTFLMGSPADAEERASDETQHRVVLTQGFFLKVYPVTQGQWQSVMGRNPSGFEGEQLPVECVSWEDCLAFCKKLSQIEGETYRLPTEAEWEYACRAGSTTTYCFGNSPSKLEEHAWYLQNTLRPSVPLTPAVLPGIAWTPIPPNGKTQPVGQKKPNAWGLHDMHGNVWEWCADSYGDYLVRDTIDPRGPAQGTTRVLRGGSWFVGPGNLRSATRDKGPPSDRSNSVGLRVCLGR